MVSVNNLLNMADNALKSFNYNEALDYYNKVLEISPSNEMAWFGKAESVGYLSSVDLAKFSEMENCFNNAIKFSRDPDFIKKQSANSINLIVSLYYKECKKHVQKYIHLDGIWDNFIQQSLDAILALETAHSYYKENTSILIEIVSICTENIEGMPYVENGKSKVAYITSEHEKKLRDLIEVYGNEIKKTEPNYKIPNPKNIKESNSCFVVTATMGNEYNVFVSELRKLRDKILLKSKAGSKFVSWYYKESPKLAKLIQEKKLLRSISFIFIVLPSFLISKFIFLIKRK